MALRYERAKGQQQKCINIYKRCFLTNTADNSICVIGFSRSHTVFILI